MAGIRRSIPYISTLLLSTVAMAAPTPLPPTQSWSTQTSTHIQLVAVQMTLQVHDYWTAEAFEQKIRSLMEQVKQKAQPNLPTLVVFPEDVGLLLALQGMEHHLQGATTIGEAIERALKTYMIPAAWIKLTKRLSWVPAFFLYRHRVIARTYFDVFSRMAREYGVYLVAGSVVLPPYALKNGDALWSQPIESQVYNTAYLFGPDGHVIGRQHKVYLIDLEEKAALDLAHGRLEDLQVFDTALGKIGIGICLDSFREDVVGILEAKGAQILVQPSANPGPWSKEQQEDWLNSSYTHTFEQKRFRYAVNPMMNGYLWDISFYGQSAIVSQFPAGPGTMHYRDLPASPGFIRLAGTDYTEEVLVVTVPRP